MWVTWRLGLKFNNYQQMLGADKIKVKRSLFPSSWSTVGGDPITFVYAMCKEMQVVMSKFTQPNFCTPVEWNENYTTYPRELL